MWPVDGGGGVVTGDEGGGGDGGGGDGGTVAAPLIQLGIDSLLDVPFQLQPLFPNVSRWVLPLTISCNPTA